MGDKMAATATMIDASEQKNEIKAGSICGFCGFDDEGDLLIAIEVSRMKPKRVVMFKEEMRNCSSQ